MYPIMEIEDHRSVMMAQRLVDFSNFITAALVAWYISGRMVSRNFS